jgi:hypothetical protein
VARNGGERKDRRGITLDIEEVWTLEVSVALGIANVAMRVS